MTTPRTASKSKFTDDKSRYKHDCQDCTFLGFFEDCDLYFCSQKSLGGVSTVIARYGDRGAEYQSGLALAGVIPALAQARDRAVEAGLLPASEPGQDKPPAETSEVVCGGEPSCGILYPPSPGQPFVGFDGECSGCGAATSGSERLIHLAANSLRSELGMDQGAEQLGTDIDNNSDRGLQLDLVEHLREASGFWGVVRALRTGVRKSPKRTR